MMPKHRMVLDLDEEVVGMLKELTTPRRKSKYISDLIRAAARAKASAPLGAGVLEQLEQRLVRVEQRLEELVPDGR